MDGWQQVVDRVQSLAITPELPELSERRRLRRSFGITQAELAVAMGVARETVARWETGARSPNGDNYVTYCTFYAWLAERDRARR